MPFQSWELRPIDVNNCLLSVIAVNIDVEMEIKVGIFLCDIHYRFARFNNLSTALQLPSLQYLFISFLFADISPATDTFTVAFCFNPICSLFIWLRLRNFKVSIKIVLEVIHVLSHFDFITLDIFR